MIALDDARRLIAETLQPTPAETLTLGPGLPDAFGRTLAADVAATRTQPPTRTSAMDGYAVRSADLGGAPTTLALIGESAAGHAFSGTVGPGQAARVSTGATLPAGADQVVMREDATLTGDAVAVDARPAPDKHTRPAGVDFSEGDLLLGAGRLLNPAACALAVSSGVSAIAVHRRPRVGVLSTGDELVEPGAPLGEGRIINSNAAGVLGAIADAGGEPVYLGIARDTEDDVRAGFARAADLDLLVTIGGASVGDHDHLRAVFAAEGGALAFEKVAVKPGKPTWFGRLSDLPVLGLPGNPVSALVMARLALRVAVRRLSGGADALLRPFREADLSGDLPGNGPRETYVRAALVKSRVRALQNQDSASLRTLVNANALIRREPYADDAYDGDTVDVLVL